MNAPAGIGRQPIAAWASVSPALLWTLAFFAVPFIAMGLQSLFPQGSTGLSLANYTQFFTNPSYWRSLTNSNKVYSNGSNSIERAEHCANSRARSFWESAALLG